MLAGGHEDEVSAFAQEALNLWVPFIIQVLEAPLPANEEDIKGLMTLKVQSIKVIEQHALLMSRRLLGADGDASTDTFCPHIWSKY